ncbi:MAG: hypothetical protein K6B72_13045 [Lachnospiraceae bacterium]|nr:hypothetical protein [Lachnospiraceae bacterium]
MGQPIQANKKKSAVINGGPVHAAPVHAAPVAPVGAHVAGPPVGAAVHAPVNVGGGPVHPAVPAAVPAQKSWWERTKDVLFRSKTTKAINARQEAGMANFVEDNLTKARVRTDTDSALEFIGSSKRVSRFSASRREASYYRRKDVQLTAKSMSDDANPAYNYTEKLQQREAAVQAFNADDFADNLKEMCDCGTRFMEFKNDENFLKHYRESMTQLIKFAGLTKRLMTMTKDDYKTLRNGHKNLKLPDLETARQHALDATYISDWYKAKLTAMSNENHKVLLDRDVDTLTDEALQAKINDLSMRLDDRSKSMHDFLVAHQEMRKYAKLGAKHAGSKDSKWRSWGNSGRTNHLWGIKLFSFKKSEYHPKFEGGIVKNLLLDQEKVSTTIMEKKQDFKSFETGEVSEGKTKEYKGIKQLGVKAEKNLVKGDINGKIAKGSYKYRKGGFTFGANLALGEVNASGKVGGSLSYDAEKGFQKEGGINVTAGATAAKGRVKIGYQGEYLGIGAKVVGKALTASATGVAGYGKFMFKDDEGKVQEADGFGVMASAQAALAEGQAEGSFSIFGIKISVGFTAQFGGVGGTIGAYGTNGKIGCSFGALLGAGFKLNASLDWTGFRKWRKARKEKAEMKKKQRADMLHNRMGIPVPPPAPPKVRNVKAPKKKKTTTTKKTTKVKGAGGPGAGGPGAGPGAGTGAAGVVPPAAPGTGPAGP